MSIAFVAAGAQIDDTTTTNTSIAIPYPAGLLAGDQLVLVVATNGGAPSVTAPGGWTTITILNATTTNTLGYFIVKADGTESGNLTVTKTAVAASGQMFAYRGVDPVTPQDAAATTVFSASAVATAVIPAITAVTIGALPVFAIACGASTLTAPGTERADFREATGVASGKSGGLYEDATPLTATGTTGTRTITLATARAYSAAMLLFRPARVPATPRMVGQAVNRSATF